jgi:hypothetical protein
VSPRSLGHHRSKPLLHRHANIREASSFVEGLWLSCRVFPEFSGAALAAQANLVISTNASDPAPRSSDLLWCRYADDGLVHCRSEAEAQIVRDALGARLAECRLELHPTKSRVVYCRDHRRMRRHEAVSFDFLGYCFRPRSVKGPSQKMFCGFTPAVSTSALNAMREAIRSLSVRTRTEVTLDDIAREINPMFGDGSRTMGDTPGQRSIRWLAISTRRWPSG